jgi:hypothetical protein
MIIFEIQTSTFIFPFPHFNFRYLSFNMLYFTGCHFKKIFALKIKM